MANPFDDIEARAAQYVTQRGSQLEQRLGYGKDGSVFATDIGTAIKVFGQSSGSALDREVECYRRLAEHGVRNILGHFVPRLIQVDWDLRIIEMTIVKRPFLLDFASVYLDYPPDFSQEVLDQWEEDKRELFGSNWPRVCMILEILKEKYDIYLFDVHPGNITFGGDADRAQSGSSPKLFS